MNKNEIPVAWLLRYQAHPELKELALSACLDEPVAQCQLGARLIRSLPEEAAYWFSRSAENGNADAQCWLAECYRDGRGVPVDHEKSEALYQLAAEGGDLVAIGRMAGVLLYPASPEEGNPRAALEMLLRAVRDSGGNHYIFYLLGEIFRYGLGRKVDNYQALHWYSKAVDLGDRDAALRLGYFYEQGIVVAKNPREAIRLYERGTPAVGDGWIDGLIRIYYRGEWPRDLEDKALKWLRVSAERGDRYDQLQLFLEGADCYPKVPTEAMQWLYRSAEAGLPIAISFLQDIGSEPLAGRSRSNIIVEPGEDLARVMSALEGSVTLWLKRGQYSLDKNVALAGNRHLQIRPLHRCGTVVSIANNVAVQLNQGAELTIEGVRIEVGDKRRCAPFLVSGNDSELALGYSQLSGLETATVPYVALDAAKAFVMVRELSASGTLIEAKPVTESSRSVRVQDCFLTTRNSTPVLQLAGTEATLQNVHLEGCQSGIRMVRGLLRISKSFFKGVANAVECTLGAATVEQCEFRQVAIPVVARHSYLAYHGNYGYAGLNEIIHETGTAREDLTDGQPTIDIDAGTPFYAIRRTTVWASTEAAIACALSGWDATAEQPALNSSDNIISVQSLRQLGKSAVTAENFRRQALDMGKANKNLAQLSGSARAGDAESAWALARHYLEAKEESAFEKALGLCRQAADGGVDAAAVAIADLVESGTAGLPDFESVNRWYSDAAYGGDKNAQWALYLALRAGRKGQPRTPQEQTLLRNAAGSIEAARILLARKK